MCGDVDMLVHPYLDGELVAEERVLVEEHVAGCPRCRELVGHEATFRENLRARLRPRPSVATATPAAPEPLRQRVLEALDRADASGTGPARPARRWAAPLGALATAAAIALFFGGSSIPGLGGRLGGGNSALVEAAIAGHMKNLPVEVGGTDDEIRAWMRGKVSVPVRPPTIHLVRLSSQPRLIGARVSHLQARDAGQIIYRVGSSQVTVYVFDPSGMEVTAAPGQGSSSRVVDGRDVYLTERSGYSVALYRDRGVGYALASDLDEDALLAFVEAALRE